MTEDELIDAVVAEAARRCFDAMPADLRAECAALAALSDPPAGMELVPFADGIEFRWVGRRLGWLAHTAILAAVSDPGVG